jgi:NAD(P)-dependent dehydrogenase (short-subunit alcohol dehydrogenase family)
MEQRAMERDPEVVVITGATAGVGRATAREFARHGARIALLARGEDALEATRLEMIDLGGEALAIPCDVANAEEVFAAADQVERELGPIDVWINDAMTSIFSPLAQIRPEEFRRVTDVTYHGQVYGTMAALRHMRRYGRGKIVSVGSALAYRGIPLQSAYCGAKHAIRGFLDSVRCELIHDGDDIDITEVHLPGMNTPQFEWCESRMEKVSQPVPPIFQPEVAARAIYFAAHHKRREIFVGLPVYKAVWGNKLAPGFLDHYLARKAYSGQMLDEPKDPDRPSNLFHPVPGDHGAHGMFDDRSRHRSPLARAGAALGAPASVRVALGAGLLALAGYGLVRAARRRF